MVNRAELKLQIHVMLAFLCCFGHFRVKLNPIRKLKEQRLLVLVAGGVLCEVIQR